MHDSSAAPFATQVRTALLDVRGALTQLVTSVGADPSRPQEMARKYRLNRTLSWKISKIIHANDPFEIVPHIPGAGGVDILLRAFESANAPRHALDAVRRAVLDVDRAVETHAGDRATFELMLDSMTTSGSTDGLERCRRLAYQGNSGVWGIQARVRFASYFLAPSSTGDGLLDVALLGGLVDVRRLRPDVTMPLFMRHQYNDDGSPIDTVLQPIVESEAAERDDLMLLREFSSDNLPPLQPLPIPGGTRYELNAGPVGNTALMTWVFGWYTARFASMYRTELNTVGEHPTRIFTPAETLMCDLFVHRDLALDLPPRMTVHGQIDGGPRYPQSGRDRDLIPSGDRIAEIEARPPAVATTLIPRYTDMVSRAFERLGRGAGEFRGFRFVMKYPPLPSVAVFRYDLPPHP